MESILMNFSGAFSMDGWSAHCCSQDTCTVLDFSLLEGTRYYLDRDAEKAVESVISPLPLRSVHWIDTGDYHYLSDLWLRKLDREAVLVLFDHHTDRQAPAFSGETLSCGSWVLHSLTANPFVRRLVSVGPPLEKSSAVDAGAPIDKASPANTASPIDACLSVKTGPLVDEGSPVDEGSAVECREGYGAGKTIVELPDSASGASILSAIPPGAPVYLSIDLDVLSKEHARTNWEQGEMTIEGLCSHLKEIIKAHPLLGVDICGGIFPLQDSLCDDHSVNYRTRLRLENIFADI